MRTDLNISTTNTDGTKKTSKLSYVNPEANDGALSTLANKITALSDDTLTAATRNDITDLPLTTTPVIVEFFNYEPQDQPSNIMPYTIDNIDNQSSIITLCVYDGDRLEELPIMVPNLMPYIKENNTRVQVTIFKENAEGQLAYAQVGLAITPTSGTNDKEEREGITPTYTGDIVIGTKTISGNYQNIAPDLIIRIVRE